MVHGTKVELQVVLTEFVCHYKFLCLKQLRDEPIFKVDKKSKHTQGSEKYCNHAKCISHNDTPSPNTFIKLDLHSSETLATITSEFLSAINFLNYLVDE